MNDAQDTPVPTGWRRRLTIVFILLWLAIQIGGPLTQKFELPSFRYRTTRFAWAMFSRPTAAYDVSLYRTLGDAESREAIPNIERFVYNFRSPDPMRRQATYQKEEEILERF